MDEQHPDTLLERAALALFQRGLMRAAIALFARRLERAPADVNPWLVLGHALSALAGQERSLALVAWSIACYERVVRDVPDHAAAREMLARIRLANPPLPSWPEAFESDWSGLRRDAGATVEQVLHALAVTGVGELRGPLVAWLGAQPDPELAPAVLTQALRSDTDLAVLRTALQLAAAWLGQPGVTAAVRDLPLRVELEPLQPEYGRAVRALQLLQ